ncbi:MAG: ATP synthase subunit I [Deltaproteobacteria bacterium]|nr:ATP synthase subunit I [Deltaproteobacteria bacterium]
MEKSGIQKKIEVGNWLVLAAAVIISSLFLPYEYVLGVIAGGLVSIANFYWLARDLKVAFERFAHKARPFIVMKFYARLLVTGVVLYFVISRLHVSVIGLVIGLSLVMLNIVITIIAMNVKNPLRRSDKNNASIIIS